jgi:hypothetical protein
MIEDPEYVSQLCDPDYPALANSFLCKGIIEENSANYVKSAWSYIHAAWACDDAEVNDPAKVCRIKAVSMIQNAIESGQKLTDDGSDTAVQVDLLRRSGRFKEAQELIATKQSEITNNIILQALAFEEKLISIGDEACHTISEAMGEDE